MLDAVLLDWEGVLADTRDARRDALLRALADENVHLDGNLYAMLCEGRSRPAAIASALRHAGLVDPTLADLVGLRASRAFAERLGKGFVLATGARELVEHLRVHAPVAIVTSATRAETEFVLRLAALEGTVATIVSADDAMDWDSGGAHREALTRLARKRQLNPQRVVALAQSAPALEAARLAGVRSIAVDAPAHVAIEADGTVDSIVGLTVADLARLAGVTAVGQRS
jgi:beta-phosphoglucomutase-like phosphatase (HAD superfamily)